MKVKTRKLRPVESALETKIVHWVAVVFIKVLYPQVSILETNHDSLLLWKLRASNVNADIVNRCRSKNLTQLLRFFL